MKPGDPNITAPLIAPDGARGLGSASPLTYTGTSLLRLKLESADYFYVHKFAQGVPGRS